MASAAPSENVNASDLKMDSLIKAAVLAAATGGVAQLSKDAVTYVWHEFTGSSRHAYSAAEVAALDKLKQIYTEYLEDKEIPDEWVLDPENKARYHFEPRPWSHLIKREAKKRDTFGILHSYVKAYVSVASGFLRARLTQRYLDKGYAGDYIELFFAAEVHWGLNLLSSYDASEQSLALLSNRIQYIQAILDESVFSASWLTYQDTPISSCIKMRDILGDCYEYMQYMSLLFGAREHLAKLKVYNEEFLTTIFNYLYLLRDKEIFIPLAIHEWISGDEKTIAEVNRCHHHLFDTHTGAMLRSLLQVSGPSAMGWGGHKRVTNLSKDEYFSHHARRLSIYATKRKPGVPFWVAESHQIDKFLAKYHACCQALHSLSRVQRLIAISHELTGMQGDLWAYGTDDGRSAVSLVCDLVRDQTYQVRAAMTNLQEFSSSIKETFEDRLPTEACHIARDARYAYEELEKYGKNIQLTLAGLANQMEAFPKRNLEEIEDLRLELYEKINQFIDENRPDLQDKRLRTDWLPAESKGLAVAEESVRSPLAPKAYAIALPHINLQLELPLSHQGASDIDWTTGFVERHQEMILDYQVACETLNRKIAELSRVAIIDRAPGINEIRSLQMQLGDILQKLKENLIQQKPGWRFYYLFGFLPIYPLSWGWPFISDKEQLFYAILLSHINTRLSQLEQRINHAISTLPTSHPQPKIELELEPEVELKQELESISTPTETDSIATSVARISLRLAATPQHVEKVCPLTAPELECDTPSPRIPAVPENPYEQALLASVMDPLEFIELDEQLPLTKLSRDLLYLLSKCDASTGQIEMIRNAMNTQPGLAERKYLAVLLTLLNRPSEQRELNIAIDDYLAFVEQNGEARQLALKTSNGLNAQWVIERNSIGDFSYTS